MPRLTVLSGPSGVGKGTVVARVRANYPNIWVSVSCTTRLPRPGERDGVEYYFVSREQFGALAQAGDLLEYAEFAGNLYGTPRLPVQRRLANGEHTMLEIDLQGARQVRAAMRDARLVFLAPPSWDELERRLTRRGTETGAAVAARLEQARIEMAAENEFDTVVVNDDVDRAAAELADLVRRLLDWLSRVPLPVRSGPSAPVHRLHPSERESHAVSAPEGITNPPIDELLERTASKYALVIIAAKRARQINAYYSQLGEGLLEYVGPLVETAPQEKPLSIALREINTDLIEFKAPEGGVE